MGSQTEHQLERAQGSDSPGGTHPPPCSLQNRSKLTHILPISSIRFVLAMWVAIGHFGVPFLREPQHDKILWTIRAILGVSFNGPAAVIVFFVISGFCIHFPNRYGLEVKSWRMYYARRYLRILIPMTVAVGISLPLKMEFGILSGSILWSLLCEEVYYLIYPVLLMVRDRIGWRFLMGISWTLAFATAATNPHAINYPSYGPQLNWVLGLPCWLLGCLLAERLDTVRSSRVTAGQIWAWRGGAWVLSGVLVALGFHTPFRYPWTLNFFGLYGFFWLEREIRYYRSENRKPLFESWGEASYSIYLTHTHGMAILGLLPFAALLSAQARWLFMVAFCLVFATAFYWLVERPSHRFARRFAKQTAWLSGSRRGTPAGVA